MRENIQGGIDDGYHPQGEVFPLMDDHKRFLGNFVKTQPQALNAFFSCEHYFSDKGGLRPLMQAVINGEMGVDLVSSEGTGILEVMARTLVGEKGGEGLTTRNLVESRRHFESLKELNPQQFSLLQSLQVLNFAGEVDYLRKNVYPFSGAVQGQDIWVVGRYHEEGVLPDSPDLRDARFAARVIGFEFDDERAVVLPVVLNSYGTLRGLLPANMRLEGDETGNWLYVFDDELRPRQPLYMAPVLDGIDELISQ